ncbi:MAG: hypothetical protein ACYDGR_03985 [Candidatus Dormibacteria bacterium]
MKERQRLDVAAVGFLVLCLLFAVHNVGLVLLYHAGASLILVKALASWKEALWLVLAVYGFVTLVRAPDRSKWRGKVQLLDGFVLGYGVFLALHGILFAHGVGTHTPLSRTLLGFKTDIILVLAYALGRVLPTGRNFMRLAAVALAVTMSAVAVAGLIEVMLVPTTAWVSLGLPRYGHDALGLSYTHGAAGLPDNFFIRFGDLLTRRLVSTYVTPLTVAFMAVLTLPLMAVLERRSRFHWPLGAALLTMAACALTITRAGVLVASAAFIVTAFLRGTRPSRAVALAASACALLFMFSPLSKSFTPRMDYGLHPYHPAVRTAGSEPTPATVQTGPTSAIQSLTEPGDSSQGHLSSIREGLVALVHHPVGTGLGSAGVAGSRAGVQTPGEDSYLSLGGETGWLGFGLLVGATGGAIALLYRRRGDDLALALLVGTVGLAVIAAETDLWGDFVVTWSVWWLIGHQARLAATDTAG